MKKLFIVKIGGNIIDRDEQLKAFLGNFSSVKGYKILVHGGGKIATQIGDKLGIVSKYIDGRRITDEETIDLVTMVYGGLINKKIVAELQALQCNAIGLTGADANLIPARKREVKEIDYGFVGDLDDGTIPANNLELLLGNGWIPVFAPLTHDGHGQMLNTNADTIASALGVALSRKYQVRLIYCFEKKGVLRHVDRDDEVVDMVNDAVYQKLLSEHKLSDGIIPKLDNAFDAIRGGVSEVIIGHAKDILLNAGDRISGTLIK